MAATSFDFRALCAASHCFLLWLLGSSPTNPMKFSRMSAASEASEAWMPRGESP